MSSGDHGHGAQLYYGSITNISSGTAIGNVISITGPNQTRDSIEISGMDSTNKWREFVPGMIDAGEITVEWNFHGSASGNADGLDDQLTASAYVWTVNFNDGTDTVLTNQSQWRASGIITALGHAIPFDDKITQSLTLKLTGAPTYTDKP